MKPSRYLKKNFQIWTLSSLALVSISCAGPRLAERPAAAPTAQALASEMYQGLWQRNRAIRTMRGAAVMRMSRGIFSRASDQFIVVERPGRLRIDSYAVFGALLYQLVYKDGALYILDASVGAARSSDDVRQLLFDELGLDLEPSDMLLLLSGGIPLEAPDNYLAVRRKGSILLRGDTSQVLLDPDTGLPASYMAEIPSGGIYRVALSDYRAIDGVPFPYRVIISLSGPKVGLDVEYTGVELNDPIDPKVFRPSSLVQDWQGGGI